MRKLRITVDGKAYEVEVELLDEPAGSSQPLPASLPPVAPASSPAPAAPPPAAASASAQPGDVPSPLAGRVVSVDCTIGAQVAAGDKILTIEAMKMNTFVTAPSAGKVTAIHVNAGDAVEEGQALVTIS